MKQTPHAVILGVSLGMVLSFLIVNISHALVMENPIGFDNLQELIEAIAIFVFRLALIIAPIMLIYAGFLFITSSGEPEKVRKAKNVFVYTLIGLVIVLTAWGLVAVIESVLQSSSP